MEYWLEINFWARMLDGNHAFRIIRNMLTLLPSDAEQKSILMGVPIPIYSMLTHLSD